MDLYGDIVVDVKKINYKTYVRVTMNVKKLATIYKNYMQVMQLM
jgi:hypothetical protein